MPKQHNNTISIPHSRAKVENNRIAGRLDRRESGNTAVYCRLGEPYSCARGEKVLFYMGSLTLEIADIEVADERLNHDESQ